MIDLLTLSIGVGLVVSLIVSEKVGRGAGGLIVPGYVAFYLTRPLDVALTIVTALATFALVRWLSSQLIVYGKRRTVMMIVVGFVFGAFVRTLLVNYVPSAGGLELAVIGYIIPGLLAIWFDRQGVLDTCTTTLTASVATRLILILFASSQLQLWEWKHTPVEPWESEIVAQELEETQHEE